MEVAAGGDVVPAPAAAFVLFAALVLLARVVVVFLCAVRNGLTADYQVVVFHADGLYLCPTCHMYMCMYM